MQKVGTLGGFLAPGRDKHHSDLGVLAGPEVACTDPGRKSRTKPQVFAAQQVGFSGDGGARESKKSRAKTLPHKAPKGHCVKEDRERHAFHRRTHRGKRHAAGDRPRHKPRHQHNRVLQIECMLFCRCRKVARKLVRKHNGERLVARNRRGEHRDTERRREGRHARGKRPNSALDAAQQICFLKNASIRRRDAYDAECGNHGSNTAARKCRRLGRRRRKTQHGSSRNLQ